MLGRKFIRASPRLCAKCFIVVNARQQNCNNYSQMQIKCNNNLKEAGNRIQDLAEVAEVRSVVWILIKAGDEQLSNVRSNVRWDVWCRSQSLWKHSHSKVRYTEFRIRRLLSEYLKNPINSRF